MSKGDLLCGRPKEKGEKVTARGQYIHKPLATLIGVHNPCTPTHSSTQLCTHPDPTPNDGIRARFGLKLLVGLGPGAR